LLNPFDHVVDLTLRRARLHYDNHDSPEFRMQISECRLQITECGTQECRNMFAFY
jgi:hypothetical protein